MSKDSGYTISVGGKTYKLKLPKFMRSKNTDAPVSVGHAVKAKTDRRNQLDEMDRQLREVGRSATEKEIFDNDYTD
jgi:hypothetical protein